MPEFSWININEVGKGARQGRLMETFWGRREVQ